jgi:hypothetical protein
MYIYDNILPNSSLNEKFVRQNAERKFKHFIFNHVCPQILPFMKECGKILYSRTRHRWRYTTAHVHFMLDTWGYKHRLRICNIYCFSTAKMVARMRLNVTLYVHCQSFLPWKEGGLSDSQAVWLYHTFQALKQFRKFCGPGMNNILPDDTPKLWIQFLK